MSSLFCELDVIKDLSYKKFIIDVTANTMAV